MISFKPKAVAIWVSVLLLGGLFLPLLHRRPPTPDMGQIASDSETVAFAVGGGRFALHIPG